MILYQVSRQVSSGGVEEIRTVSADGVIFDVKAIKGQAVEVKALLALNDTAVKMAVRGAKTKFVFQSPRMAHTRLGWSDALNPQAGKKRSA